MGYAVKLQSREIATITTGIRLATSGSTYPKSATFKIYNGLVVGYYTTTESYIRQYGNGSLVIINGILTENVRIPSQPFSTYMPYTYSANRILTITPSYGGYYYCLDICIIN